MGTESVKKANDTIMEGVQCLNSFLLRPNSDCVEFKKGKNIAKNKKLRFAKNIFIFACSRVGYCSGGQYGSEKPCGEGVLAKKSF